MGGTGEMKNGHLMCPNSLYFLFFKPPPFLNHMAQFAAFLVSWLDDTLASAMGEMGHKCTISYDLYGD